jgi:hypothetical protein
MIAGFYSFLKLFVKGVSKIVDHVQWQGVLRFESGAYTSVREHFKLRDNIAIGREMHF